MTYQNYFQEFAERLARIEDCLLVLSDQQRTPVTLCIEEKPITIVELAKDLKLCHATIHAHKRAGKIPFHRLQGRTFYYLSEVKAAMSLGFTPQKTRKQKTAK